MAFLSSRIQESEAKFLSAAEARVECGGVNGYWDRGCVVIGGQVGMQFQADGGCGLGWSQVIRFSLLYSTAEEGHCDLAEIFIFVSFSSLYVLATLTRGLDDALVSLR